MTASHFFLRRYSFFRPKFGLSSRGHLEESEGPLYFFAASALHRFFASLRITKRKVENQYANPLGQIYRQGAGSRPTRERTRLRTRQSRIAAASPARRTARRQGRHCPARARKNQHRPA